MRTPGTVLLLALVAGPAEPGESAGCRILCTPELKLEPAVTFGGVLGRARLRDEDGTAFREPRQTAVELILSLGVPTRARRLGFTVEAIVTPFDRDATPELELEMNLVWLHAARTGGWVSSHFDVVDKFSAAARPMERRAYTHKLNLELDTSVAVFRRVDAARWLRGVELEVSLDYVATGLARAGDAVGGRRYLDGASPWSISIVLVLPLAPF